MSTGLRFETVALPFLPKDGGPGHKVDVMGEHVAPGLAIVPMLGFEKDGTFFYLGGFQLIHTVGGKHIGTDQLVTCLGCVEHFAKAVVATGIDWTLPDERIAELVKSNVEVAAALGDAAIGLLLCDESECETSCSRGDGS